MWQELLLLLLHKEKELSNSKRSSPHRPLVFRVLSVRIHLLVEWGSMMWPNLGPTTAVASA